MTVPTPEEERRVIQALLAICPVHIANGKAVMDLDCGNCGSRLEAAQLYMLSRIEDVRKALNL